jgi:hypothetical protein
MERAIRESDWKLFREFQPLALDRFCQRVLAEVSRVSADAGRSNHERYLAVFKLLQRRDEELAEAFDDPRRSTAVVQLARIRFQELLSEEEFARFSPEARAAVQSLLEIWQAEPPAAADRPRD